MTKYNGRKMHWDSKPWNPTVLSQGDSNRAKYMLADVPVLGDMIRAGDSYRAMNDYLRNRGLSWSDVKYPGIERGAGVTSGLVSPAMSTAFHMLYGRNPNLYVKGRNSRYPPVGYR